jgi:hypothetical protein
MSRRSRTGASPSGFGSGPASFGPKKDNWVTGPPP